MGSGSFLQTYNKEEDFNVLDFGLLKLYPDLFFIIPNATVKSSMLYGTIDGGRRITLTWFFGSWVVRKGSRRNWVRLMLYYHCAYACTRYC